MTDILILLKAISNGMNIMNNKLDYLVKIIKDNNINKTKEGDING